MGFDVLTTNTSPLDPVFFPVTVGRPIAIYRSFTERIRVYVVTAYPRIHIFLGVAIASNFSKWHGVYFG